MRTAAQKLSRSWPRLPLLFSLLLYSLLLALFTFGAGPAAAQNMAHRGWAGGGSTAEPWWHRAVFYRIDPARFQASGDADTGDLAGIARRLDYLQSLGVDALVLQPATTSGATPTAPFDPEALESLIREASRHDLRIIPTLTPALEHGNRSLLLQTVHDWLGEGAAGVALPEAAMAAAGESAVPSAPAEVVMSLANLLRSTPGDRVLLTGPAEPSSMLPPGFRFPTKPDTRIPGAHSRGLPGSGSGRLVIAATLPAAPATIADLRLALIGLVSGTRFAGASRYPLLQLAEGRNLSAPGSANSASLPSSNAVAAAAVLLASPTAALFDFGAELGLDTRKAQSSAKSKAPLLAEPSASSAPLMQWTPTNIRQTPFERPTPAALPVPGQATPFGDYRPFVRPPPHALTGNVPVGPLVELDRNLPPPLPDPATLPGFTTGELPVTPVNGETLNVATQERDPRSVLNAFRDLLGLRRGNPALREGTQILLVNASQAQAIPGKEAEAPSLGGRIAGNGLVGNVIVFARRPPPGARSAETVVVAANLGDQPVVLSLDAKLVVLHLRPGPVRALFTYGPQALTGESTAALRLPPHAVFVGELPGAGR